MKTKHKEVAPQDLFVHGGLRPVQLQLSTQTGCFLHQEMQAVLDVVFIHMPG